MSSCSKAPWGLFVLPSVGRIFTAISISPSTSLRQYGTGCTFRAGRQLSDKELRYLRTIIVIADVHQGFHCKQYLTISPTQLTFWHRSGFSPYTSSFEFARTCVFGKQSIPILLLCPAPNSTGRASFEITPSCFAEFLKLVSLAPLGLLDQSTCVGCRYDLIVFSLRSFSRMLKSRTLLVPEGLNSLTHLR